MRDNYCNNCERILSINNELSARAEKANEEWQKAINELSDLRDNYDLLSSAYTHDVAKITRLEAANKVLEDACEHYIEVQAAIDHENKSVAQEDFEQALARAAEIKERGE